MFDRPHHNAIAKVLKALDAKLLLQAEAWFGGGTAIVLQIGEYRESVDIDLLCASRDGYRLLRGETFGGLLDKIISPGSGVVQLRGVRADQYGIRTQIEVHGTRIKFEIVGEERIDLSGAMDARRGIPLLSHSDIYCEELLANADRYADSSVLSRDMIDLSMMIARWGPIPEAAWVKAEGGHGQSVRAAFEKAVTMVRNPAWLGKGATGKAMDSRIAEVILAVHGGPVTPK